MTEMPNCSYHAWGPQSLRRHQGDGALEKVFSIDRGEALFGTLVLHHWDERTGQFATLPSVPQYCRATPSECVPCLGKPLPSSTKTPSGVFKRAPRRLAAGRSPARSAKGPP
jgi:hypothetical protein